MGYKLQDQDSEDVNTEYVVNEGYRLRVCLLSGLIQKLAVWDSLEYVDRQASLAE